MNESDNKNNSDEIAGFPYNQYNEAENLFNQKYLSKIKWEQVENSFEKSHKHKNLTGYQIIAECVKHLPLAAGVYRMLNKKSEVLYVGKARQLKKRVQNYTSPVRNTKRINNMISETYHMEFIITNTETEALLLEANLIKQLQPKYNFLLRDDKSFPYIFINNIHNYPGIFKHRGSKSKNGKYYGPFASVSAVNQTILMLQKAFLLRTCNDAIFKTRKRPCLLYQIKRCSAPCDDKISDENYNKLVQEATAVLAGKSQKIQEDLSKAMLIAAENKQYETAALYRDRLAALSHIQSHQKINIKNLHDTDVIVLAEKSGHICIQIFFFRLEQNWGNRSYFPKADQEIPSKYILTDFITQFYSDKYIPKEILISDLPHENDLIEQALTLQKGKKVTINCPIRGSKQDIVEQCKKNAEEALNRKLSQDIIQHELLNSFAKIFNIKQEIKRIEIYDNSHFSGSHPVGVMVVAGKEGFIKNQYRKYNIKSTDMKPGDDLAMMKEVLSRRIKSLLNNKNDEIPDVLLIDGGKTQLNAVLSVLEEFKIKQQLTVIAIAKGKHRNAGREKFFMESKEPFTLPHNDPTLFFIQRLRDEAHRFAIETQKNKRKIFALQNPLDEIKGIGAKRKKALLEHFGTTKAIAKAAIEDLQKVNFISKTTAKLIHDWFQKK
ncbi:excinuclease ABC subunit UvrC [Bartonella sp. DGB1]|uniref:excinuclease ABC subunit UvrC n=1 Tax=Bartonella sp. DGB1 TaxID=3239807 RepID=UPI003525C58A